MAFTTVTGSNGVTSLVGTSGIDAATIVTLSDKVFVGAQENNDVINIALGGPSFTANQWTVNGGAGSDVFTSFDNVLNSVINGDGGTGTSGDDSLGFTATVINSAINGGSGNDAITDSFGNATGNGVNFSNSTVNGNAGDDSIRLGVTTASFIYGGQDTDTITTETGADSSSVLINGNKGSDTITLSAAGFASSTIYGGNGNDTISAAFMNAGAGVALTASSAGTTISGDLGDDTVTGSNGKDKIDGGDGADLLTAGTGADTVNGGAGNDIITGEAAGDTLTGGGGLNVFSLTALTDATVNGSTGFDTITDFVANTAATTFTTASGVTTGTPNGDRIDSTLAVAAVGTSAPVNGSTFADLQAALGSATITAGATLVNITGNVSFAGNYVVLSANAAYDNAADAVIKVNTLANIGVNTFV